MKRTVLERIAGLKEMMDRMESPELVMAEVNEIMDAINKEQDKEKKDQALGAMMKLTLDMMKETPIERLIKGLDERVSKKVIPVEIKVKQYLDTTIIEIDKKVPYSNLLRILRKVRNTFDQDMKDLYSASYDAEDKHLVIDYKNEIHKDIIIDMSKWNLNEEVAEVYIEGFVEYLAK